MLTDQTIVCFSSIDWDAVWQVPQEIMSRFARAGNRVIFVESTGVRRARLRDFPRLRQRLRNWISRRAATPPPQGIRIISPIALPFPYARLAVMLNTRVLRRGVERAIAEAGGQRPIVWAFLPTPVVREVAVSLAPRLLVYHCADDFGSSSSAAAGSLVSERELIRAADLVLATSFGLAARARRDHPHVHLAPAGVALERFERVRLGDAPPPADLADLPRPVVGYVGGLNHRVDDALVAGVARRLPGVTFAFVGPLESRLPAMAAAPNVRLLGARPHEEMPRYIKSFDAAIIPYVETTFTHHIYPVKLNEYLAMGVPVVATRLNEILRFIETHGDVATAVSGVDAFAQALEAAIADRDPVRRDARMAVAREAGWDRRMHQMVALVEERLAARERRAAGEGA